MEGGRRGMRNGREEQRRWWREKGGEGGRERERDGQSGPSLPPSLPACHLRPHVKHTVVFVLQGCGVYEVGFACFTTSHIIR